MNVGDVVQLKSDALSDAGVAANGYRLNNLMTVEDMRGDTVACVFFRDLLVRREDIAAHCLIVIEFNKKA